MDRITLRITKDFNLFLKLILGSSGHSGQRVSARR